MNMSKPSRRATTPSSDRTFLANAAHELRTPLHSANGFVEMVLDNFAGPLNDRQREMLGYAHTAIDQLTDLIEEILFIARADSGELKPLPTSVDPAAVLSQAIESVRDQARQKNITLTKVIASPPVMITADGERLREGLAGLLRSSMSLVPLGGDMTAAASARDDLFAFDVTLHDVKLNATDLRHVFDRFYQPRPIGADRAANPGLGLVVAKITAGWHDGNVHTSSTPGGSLMLCYEVPLGNK